MSSEMMRGLTHNPKAVTAHILTPLLGVLPGALAQDRCTLTLRPGMHPSCKGG